MKRACIRLVLLAAALGALVAVPTDCKYITDIAPLNYNLLAVFPASIPPGQRDLMSGSPVYGNDSRGINQGRYGFDFVYYTPPVIATAGTTGGGAFAGSNGHPADTHTNSGTQLILYDCPAGWYAFKLRGGDGGFGRCWSSGDYCGAGGAGGRGATVSGYTYMEGGTIIVRAGKIGKKNSRSSSAQWGGGMAHGSAWAGAGGGYSGIFCDTSGGTTADGTTAVAIAGGGGGGGGGARVSGNGYNCRGWGGAGSGYNTADNGAGLPTAASPGPWGGRGGGGAGSGEHKDPSGRGTATGGGNDGNLGSGGGGGGGGGNRDCRDKGHIAFGGGGGVLTYNALAVPYFGKGGGGGAGYGSGEYGGNGAGEYGGWVTSGTHMGGATRGTSMSEAGGTGTGGTGGYSSGGSSGNGGGGGGGGYAGGGGGGHGSRNGGGGGGGSSYLKAEVYPLAAEASLPGLPAPWATRIPADPNVAATTDDRDKSGDSDGLITSSNGFAWIMYLGARNPNDTKPPADAEKGIDGGYTDIP